MRTIESTKQFFISVNESNNSLCNKHLPHFGQADDITDYLYIKIALFDREERAIVMISNTIRIILCSFGWKVHFMGLFDHVHML